MLHNNLVAMGEILCEHKRALTILFLLVSTSTVKFDGSSSGAPNITLGYHISM
jgi:hypothetical protein